MERKQLVKTELLLREDWCGGRDGGTEEDKGKAFKDTTWWCCNTTAYRQAKNLHVMISVSTQQVMINLAHVTVRQIQYWEGFNCHYNPVSSSGV